jgi:hypothetical protein
MVITFPRLSAVTLFHSIWNVLHLNVYGSLKKNDSLRYVGVKMPKLTILRLTKTASLDLDN